MARISSEYRRIAAALFALAVLPVRAETALEPRNELSFATTTFSVDSGLPSNVAQALVQTTDGYLWVGTEGGLARFDGVRFRIFRTNEVPALGDNLVRCLAQARDGALWIGTQAGVARYIHGHFERIAVPSAPIGAMAEDSTGVMWIGTQGHGLWSWKGGVLEQHVDAAELKATDSPMRVFVDRTDRVWLTVDRGPLLYVKQGRIHVPGLPMAALRQTNRMAETAHGTLWFGMRNELVRVRNGVATRFGQAAGIGDEQITDLMVDHSGRLWVAGRGLWVAPDPERDEFVRVEVPKVEYPRYVMEDREGTIWIGSSGDGLARMRASSFRMVNHADDVPLRRARSVTADPSGAIWAAFGEAGHEVGRMAPGGSFTWLNVGTGANADVMALVAARDGAVWLGTRGALGVWRDGRLTRFPAYQNVRVLFEARDRSIWLGVAGGGVVRWRNGSFEPIQVPAEFAAATPSTVADGERGVVYVGYLTQGILRIDEAGAQPLGGLPAREIRAIHLDAEGRLWVGFRRNGLAVRIDGKWCNPDELSQPFGERVTAIDEDGEGNLWLGTVRGVTWGRKDDFVAVARQVLPPEGRFHLAGVAEGVGGGVVGAGTQPTMCKAPDGTLWFASREGLVAARPGTILSNRVPPPVRIEAVTVDGREVPAPGELKLPAGVRSLAIDYTAMSFVQPGRVLFRYRLVGHDNDWVQAGTRRTAFYTRLEPGRFEFRVTACNEDGVWNDTGATMTIVQAPWFYETWWFYGLLAAAIGSVGMGLYHWRTGALRRLVARQTTQIRQQLEKESQLRAELERSARLESLGVLAGGIAHDFNNLLTVVIANLGLAAADDRVTSVAGDLIEAAQRGATRAAELTQQLLTFAKGGDPVRGAVSLPDVVREAAEFARHGSAVRCDISVEPGLPAADADRGQISRVVHNLVLNATQAMPHGGIVRIAMAATQVQPDENPSVSPGRYVKLTIADEGSGIAPEHLPHVFEPYFSTKPKNHGLGLATVHSIIKKHGGHITVQSELGRGTVFQIWLPAAAAASAPAPAAGRDTPGARSSVRVLFMDDEEVIREVAGGILRHLGHEATIVADGAEAVRAYESAHAARKPYDVVVLDLTVPGGVGGREAIEAIRQIEPRVRAVVSSGYSSDPVLANPQRYGFLAVVPKPYQVEQLARAIERAAVADANAVENC
jgi:signal transduction histidine kinase/ligand-binding sensor domain-containing protein/CheY-like chemotaxis protein